MSDDAPPPSSPPPPVGGNRPPRDPDDAPPPGPRREYDLGDAFSWAWRSLTDHALFVVVGMLIIGVLNLVVSGIGYGVTLAVFGLDQGLTTRADGTADFDAGTYFGSLGLQAAIGFGFGLFLSILYVNYLRGLIAIAGGDSPALGQLFGLDRVGTAMLTWLIVNVVGSVAYLLVIVPGIVWQFFTVFSLIFVAAGAASATQAIGSSLRLVKDNAGSVFVLALVCVLLVIAGTCACDVGLLVAFPIALLLLTYAFRVLQGHHVAG